MIKTKTTSKSNSIYTINAVFKRWATVYHIQNDDFEYHIQERDFYPIDYFAFFTTFTKARFEIRSTGEENEQFSDWRAHYTIKYKGVVVDLDRSITAALLELKAYYVFIFLKNNELEFNLTSEELLDEDAWHAVNKLICGLNKQFKLYQA